MIDVLFTVECGEYSDHHIHGFYTSLEGAKVAAAKIVKDYEDNVLNNYTSEEDRESMSTASDRWPKVFSNPTNIEATPTRVKWCDRDDAK